ncbi:MAG: hypothetical protein KAZ14_00045 [Nitrosomonas sp.]|nr:hypothetical protein [Nitrosomonas sp.]
MAVDFPAWLDDSSAIRCVLVEVVTNVSGSNITRYLSSKAYSNGSQIYDLIVNADSVQLIERMSIDGQPSMSFGDIELYNIDGSIDSWLFDIWVNKIINVYIGDVRWIRSDFVTIFSGVVDDIDSKSKGSINIKIRDKLQRLNTPMTEVKLGGTTVNKNELIPLCFGECFNVTPLLSNPATLEFQVHSGAIEDIVEVRDNGVPVAITKNLAAGKFTLANQPFGQVTTTVQGDKPSLWNTTASKIIQRIATVFGGTEKLTTADFDTAQLAAFDTANTMPVGVYLTSRENTLSACNSIANSVGAQLVMSRLGKLQLLKIGISPLVGAFTIDENDIVSGSLSISQKLPIKAAFKVNFDKNWTIQSDLQTGIPKTHKDMYALEYVSVTAQDNTVKTAYGLDSEPIAVDTMLLKESDATTEANRLLNIYKQPRFVVTFTGTPRLIQLELGQQIKIKYPRFGMDSIKDGQVIGLSVNWANLTTKVEVLI